jgi:Bacterial virulence protein (VirJ)
LNILPAAANPMTWPAHDLHGASSMTASANPPVSVLRKWTWRRRALLLSGLILLAAATGFVAHLVLPRNFAGSGEHLALQLPGGPWDTLYYGSARAPRGIILLASGDGGWSKFDERVARHLVETGYAVAGWDCRKFADSRKYDQAQLIAGFKAAVVAVAKRSGASSNVPVWYGGWSTGAEQAVAAAATTDRPAHLVGLLLAAPGAHGRYGILLSDLMGQEPGGPGSFALTNMAPALTGLRVVQFAAGLDPLDDTSWLKKVTVPHKLIKLPGEFHNMGGFGPEFQQKMDEAITWTLAR